MVDEKDKTTLLKDIRAFRKRRKDGENLKECFSARIIPSYPEFLEQLEKAADSEWFALKEIKRFHDHNESIHNDDSCKLEGCIEDFTMEDSMEYATTIFNHLRAKELNYDRLDNIYSRLWNAFNNGE
jgi:hypothetical protein